ncbi:MAG: chromosomal replication initiator protein DnaA [Clostridiales bacterium]|nr:chromosomal replication initiator protein DnaA [Candidatus Apopatousia equi]
MMQNLRENWTKVLDLLEKEVTAVSFDLWIKSLEPIEVKNSCLVIKASSETAKQRILTMHSQQLKLIIADVFDDVNSFEVLNPDEFEEYEKLHEQTTKVVQEEVVKEQQSQKFNPKYTFDSFVVGKSNQFVYAASRNVAENPSGKINPLFIYGGVGLGKTHLMHAVGNYLNANRPELKVVYVTCEKFTNDYIDSLRGTNKDKGIHDFREKYRNVDVLIIDDIQFITNKLETQEEFFHTFSDLYENNKQIIIASDRPPKEIATLSDRLKSRFASGLMQDVQTPDFETRVAILKKKADQENYNVEDEVIDFLAEKIDTNVRELEGSLAKVCFYANLLGKKFATMDDANEALKDEVVEKEALSPNQIIDVVCKYYNVAKQDLVGKKKNKEIVDPRQMCMYLITELLDLPLASIGMLFGGRDHTTIIHARDKITAGIKTNPKLKMEATDLKNLVYKQ